MAVRRIFLAAHHGHDARACLALERPDTTGERRRRRNLAVEDVPVGVEEPLPLWSPAQLLAEEDVVDTRGADGLLERLLVELRRIPRPGVRADVDKQLDSMLGQQRQ